MIKVKSKPCKGIGKASGYGCGKITKDRKYGLGKSCKCYSNWLLNSDEGKSILNKATLKATKPRKDLKAAELSRKKEKSLQGLILSLVNVCHKYIRLRDSFKNCISCGAIWNEHFQAGHFLKAELYSSLRFDPKNINGQCRVCNLHKDGNYEGYRKGFIDRYGIEELNILEDKALKYKSNTFKWDREELKKQRANYNIKIKTL